MVYKDYKVDYHKLKTKDIGRVDRQNLGSTQRISSRNVHRCLKEMRSTGGRIERTLGIETYLEIVAAYIDFLFS